jgi:hypothetical protein
MRTFGIAVACAVAVAAPAGNGTSASATKLTATLGSGSVGGVFLASLNERTLTWRFRVVGLRAPLSARLITAPTGAAAGTLCTSCRSAASGRTKVSARAATALLAGRASIEVRRTTGTKARVRARIVLGAPTLEITAPQDGDTITLPAQISYRISNFKIGDAPLGHIEVSAAGIPSSVEIDVSAQSGTATLPDVKSAFLPGRRDLTFVLATADRVPLPNAEARVTVHDVTIEGRR